MSNELEINHSHAVHKATKPLTRKTHRCIHSLKNAILVMKAILYLKLGDCCPNIPPLCLLAALEGANPNSF